MDFLALPRLVGRHTVLDPLALDDADELAAAVAEDDLHTLWYTRVPAPGTMQQEIRRRLEQHAAGAVVPWTVRRSSDGQAVGMTTFLHLRPEHRRLEIGSTWLSASEQGTGINTEAKLLQLTHAFEELHCIAVELRAHWHNRRSRAAIAALGAKQDGVLRNHDLWRDGTMRDVVVFSILESEWPAVRRGLTERLRR